MKKKISYESKYFTKKANKKSIQTYIVLCFLIFIFIVIIAALFFLFGNKVENAFINQKYDEYEIKKEVRLFLKLKEYELLDSKIDEYLNLKIDKKLVRNLIYLKSLILMTLNDSEKIKAFADKYKKILSKDDYNFLNGYLNFIKKNYDDTKKYLYKINKTSLLYRDSAIILAKILFAENKVNEAIKVLEKVDNKDDAVLYNLAYLFLSKNDFASAQLYINSIGKIVQNFQTLSFKVDLLRLQISIENESWDIAKNSLVNIHEYPFLDETYFYNLLLVSFKSSDNDRQDNYLKVIEKTKENDNYSFSLYQLIFTVLYFENMNKKAVEVFEDYKERILQGEYEKYLACALDLYDKTENYTKIVDMLDFNLLNSISEKYFEFYFQIYYKAMLNEKRLDQFNEICFNLLKTRNEKYLILNFLVESFINQKKYDEGINYLLNYSLITNYPPYYYLFLAKLYIYKGDERNAIKNLKIIEKMNLEGYDKDEIYSFICSYYLKTKKLDDFKKLFSLISEEGKNKFKNLQLLLKYDYISKNYDEIIELSNRISEKGIHDKNLLFYMAKAYYEKKEYSKATIYFSNLLESSKSLKEKAIFAIYLGNCNAYLGNFSSAKFFYKQAMVWDNNQTYSIVNTQILEKFSK